MGTPRTSLIAGILALVGSATSATGGFFDNKASWDEVPPTLRHGYAMGYWDRMMMLSTEATGLNNYMMDLEACVLELELSAQHLVEIIDLQYQDVSTWQFGPGFVLAKGLREACLDRINAYRTQRGELPLE